MSSIDKDKCEFSWVEMLSVVFFFLPIKYFDSGFYVFNMCTFNLKCTLYEYMDSFVCVSSFIMPYLFIFSAFVRKWWRAILIAIGVFLYLLYLAIFIALAAIFAPQNGKSKDRNLCN